MTLPQEELATLARNHKIACENIDYLTHALQSHLALQDRANLLRVLMAMQYAAARTDYLVQCHLIRTKPVPVTFSHESTTT